MVASMQTRQKASVVIAAHQHGNLTIVAVHFRDFEDDNYSYRLQNL